MMRADRLYDLFGSIYDRVVTPLDQRALARGVERLKAGSPKTVLEVAVGAGRGLRELVEQATTAKVVGVDIAGHVLTQARKALATGAVRLARADARHLPFPDHAFDAVMSTYLLELLSPADGRTVLGEMARVTAPGGRVVVGILQLNHPVVQKALTLASRAAPELLGQRPLVHLDGLFPPPGLRLLLDEVIPGSVGMRLFTMMKVGG